VLSGAALIFFAYIGFDEITTLSQETRNSSKTIPRAVLLALAISTAVYTLTAIVAVSVVGAETLGTSERPLADVIDAALHRDAGGVISVVAMVATASTALLMLTAISRIVYGMAEAGFLPDAAGAVHPRTRVPVRAIVAAGAASLAFTLTGDLGTIAGATDGLIFAVFVCVNLAAIILRFRRPDTARPFRIPLAIAKVPLPAAAAIAVTGVFIARLEVLALLIAAGVLLLGVTVYGVLRLGGPGDRAEARP
jgi:APA family basic amino acid/polyamine antiporter